MALITSRQQLTTLCEQAYQTWPDVRAILLFGSRARGMPRPDSNWDIAVIVDDPAIDHVIQHKHSQPPSLFDGYDNLDVLTLTPTIIAQDRRAFGRIAQQIDHDGTPIIGDWIMNHPTSAPAALILPKDWRMGITMCLKHSDEALIDISRYKQIDSYDYAESYCRLFVDGSQMAAEHLVKTMLKRRKVPPQNTHDMTGLVAQIRAQCPDDVAERDWTALADRIAALKAMHTAIIKRAMVTTCLLRRISRARRHVYPRPFCYWWMKWRAPSIPMTHQPRWDCLPIVWAMIITSQLLRKQVVPSTLTSSPCKPTRPV